MKNRKTITSDKITNIIETIKKMQNIYVNR